MTDDVMRTQKAKVMTPKLLCLISRQTYQRDGLFELTIYQTIYLEYKRQSNYTIAATAC